jgi:cytochrome d ubiquinol oxidase subunit II
VYLGPVLLSADDRPLRFTLWEAASSPSTQAFLLVGTPPLLPIILLYKGWSHWVFRGKVRGEVGYP